MNTMPISEKDMSQNIVDVAQQAGWKVYRTFNSTRSPRGFPDLVMLRAGKLCFWELKSKKGTLTAQQEEWIYQLHLVPGADVRIVRPDDLEEAYRTLLSG